MDYVHGLGDPIDIIFPHIDLIFFHLFLFFFLNLLFLLVLLCFCFFLLFLQTLMPRADFHQIAAREMLCNCMKLGTKSRSSTNGLEPGSPQRSSAWWRGGGCPSGRTPCPRRKGSPHQTLVPPRGGAHCTAGVTRQWPTGGDHRGPLGTGCPRPTEAHAVLPYHSSWVHIDLQI